MAALPRLFPVKPFHIGPAVVSQQYLWAAVICLALFGLLSLFFRYHKMGIAMRATADDQRAVQACGIPVTRIFSRSWMFACVLAAVGGVLMSSIGGITFGLVGTGLKAFSVVILGGLDSFLGAMIAGPIIGTIVLLPLTVFFRGWIGGLMAPMRDIVQGILGSSVPVGYLARTGCNDHGR